MVHKIIPTCDIFSWQKSKVQHDLVRFRNQQARTFKFLFTRSRFPLGVIRMIWNQGTGSSVGIGRINPAWRMPESSTISAIAGIASRKRLEGISGDTVRKIRTPGMLFCSPATRALRFIKSGPGMPVNALLFQNAAKQTGRHRAWRARRLAALQLPTWRPALPAARLRRAARPGWRCGHPPPLPTEMLVGKGRQLGRWVTQHRMAALWHSSRPPRFPRRRCPDRFHQRSSGHRGGTHQRVLEREHQSLVSPPEAIFTSGRAFADLERCKLNLISALRAEAKGLSLSPSSGFSEKRTTKQAPGMCRPASSLSPIQVGGSYFRSARRPAWRKTACSSTSSAAIRSQTVCMASAPRGHRRTAVQQHVRPRVKACGSTRDVPQPAQTARVVFDAFWCPRTSD